MFFFFFCWLATDDDECDEGLAVTEFVRFVFLIFDLQIPWHTGIKTFTDIYKKTKHE